MKKQILRRGFLIKKGHNTINRAYKKKTKKMEKANVNMTVEGNRSECDCVGPEGKLPAP